MTFDDLLQGAALALVLYGSWEAGSQHTRAYAAKLGASGIQAVVGITHGIWGVTAIGILLSVLQIRAIWLWRNKGVSW